ncbi:hypothetical protein EVAR_2388_1 [Eumeta japonica]|uniref:Uncharacterized protein n=1 Tax=Eumeta variegata TaxID=151549 RepID=A0A4C1SNR4_EUMVA|nr:hypothetical protein EVAR_2388_1 [Eumeta japonica]
MQPPADLHINRRRGHHVVVWIDCTMNESLASEDSKKTIRGSTDTNCRRGRLEIMREQKEQKYVEFVDRRGEQIND